MEFGLELQALHVRRSDVGRKGAGRREPRPRDRAARQGQDDVFVLVEEPGRVEAHSPVEELRLQAEFIGGQGLGPECQLLRDVERPRINAPALIAGRVLRIDHHIPGDVIVDIGAPVPPLSLAGRAREPGRRPVEAEQRAVRRIADIERRPRQAGRRHGPVRIVARIGIGLVLPRRAHAARDFQGVRQVEGRVGEQGPGGRGGGVRPMDEAQRSVAPGPSAAERRDAGAHIGQVDPGPQCAVLDVAEGAEGVVELVVQERAVQPQLLAPLTMLEGLEQLLDRDGRAVGVVAEVVEIVAGGGDELQAGLFTQLPVDRS